MALKLVNRESSSCYIITNTTINSQHFLCFCVAYQLGLFIYQLNLILLIRISNIAHDNYTSCRKCFYRGDKFLNNQIINKMKYVLFTLFLIFPFLMKAQSLYVLDTDKAISIGPEVNVFEDFKTLGLAGGMSIKGRTDVYLKVSNGSFDDSDFSRLQFTLGVDYFLLKQKSGASFSWSFGGSFAPYKINSDELKEIGASLTGSEITLGTDFYKSINLSALRIIPRLGIGYNTNKLTAKFGSDKETDTDSRVLFAGGIDFDISAGSNRIVIGPEVLFSEGYQGFGISLRYVLVK